jgi:phosphoribosyl-ATP pyrophosphohydrolase
MIPKSVQRFSEKIMLKVEHFPRVLNQTAAFASANDGGGLRCYGSGMPRFTIADLEQRISDRAKAPAEESYTRKLLDKGAAQCAKKFGEEAVEAVLAAAAEDRDHVIAESADVLYHLLVMMHARGVTLAEVEALLESRTKKSGLDEKASRPGK